MLTSLRETVVATLRRRGHPASVQDVADLAGHHEAHERWLLAAEAYSLAAEMVRYANIERDAAARLRARHLSAAQRCRVQALTPEEFADYKEGRL